MLNVIRSTIVASSSHARLPNQKLVVTNCVSRTSFLSTGSSNEQDQLDDSTSTPTTTATTATTIKRVDYTKVPVVDESDLEEKFVSGWGPGGQKVNKSLNCCQLRHKPTGLSVKVHQSRKLEDNRKIARELLVQKLDNLFNGQDSVESQKKRLAQHRLSVRESQSEKKRELKELHKQILADTVTNDKVN